MILAEIRKFPVMTPTVGVAPGTTTLTLNGSATPSVKSIVIATGFVVAAGILTAIALKHG